MSEFEVGDRVKVVRGYPHAIALVGQTGVVTDCTAENLWPYSVEFDDGGHEVFEHTEIELVVEDEPDYGTSGETSLTYEADKTSQERDLRTEALFAAIQSFQGWSYQPTAVDLTIRAEVFLKFLEGKND